MFYITNLWRQTYHFIINGNKLISHYYYYYYFGYNKEAAYGGGSKFRSFCQTDVGDTPALLHTTSVTLNKQPSFS